MKSYTRYICVNSDGKPLAVDHSSGGYPYVPEWKGEPDWGSIKSYWTIEAAQEYARVFNWSTPSLSVKKITITIED